MNLNQIIWYSLALGILGFTIIFIVSLIISRMNRKPLPYADSNSLRQPSMRYRNNNRNVMKVNHYYQIKRHSIDLATQDIRIQRAQTYKRHAEVGSGRRETSAGSRFTVLNRNLNSDERINPAHRTYTRGLTVSSGSHFV